SEPSSETPEEANKKNLATISREGERFLPLLFKKMEQNLFQLWDRLQAFLDAWIRNALGPNGVKAKELFDKIFHTVFITFLMGPAYRLGRWMLFLSLETYSKLRGGANLELGRASLIDTKVNRNLLFKIGDQFRKTYVSVI